MSFIMRRLSFQLVVMCAVCFGHGIIPLATVCGQHQPDSSFRQVTLPNGMRVLIEAHSHTPFMHLGLFYAAGSASEPDSLAGLAHLVEHLMFTSSQNYPAGDLRRKLTLYSTYANASTWQYGMVMRTVCLPQFLPEILKLEADRLAHLEPDSLELAREKLVVSEELALRNRQSAREDLTSAIFRAAYPGHPYARPVIGTEESLRRITRRDVSDFRRAWLQPGQAVLVLIGPMKPADVLALVQEHFGSLPAADGHPASVDSVPPASHATVILDRYDHEGFTVALGFRLPLRDEKDRAMARFLASFLEVENARTRLKTLPGEAFLTVSSSFRYREREQSRRTEAISDQDAQAGISAIWQAIDVAALRLLDPQIFSEIRNQTLDRLTRSARDPDHRIWSLGLDALNGYSPLRHDRLLSILLQIDRNEFQTYLRRELDASRVVAGVLHGGDSGRLAQINLVAQHERGDTLTGQDPFTSLSPDQIRPVLEVYAAAATTRIVNFELRNGIPVHFLSMPGAGRLDLGGVKSFPGLQDERPGKKQGIGLMYNLLVDHGFQSPARTYLSKSPSYRPPFAARFQVLPFELRYHARGDPGQAEAMANTLVARLASDDFNLARWRRLVEGGSSSFIRMQRQPTTRATLYRWSSLFGVNHPVLGRWQGDPRTADQIKYKDIQKFHRQLAKTGHTHILAAGEMEINPLADTLNLVFGGREKFTPCQAEPPPRLLTTIQGAVFSAFDQEDVRLTLSFPPLAAGGKTGPGWAEVQLLEEVLRMSLYNRLRLEAGVIYTVGVVARKGDGCLVPEIYTSCLPTRAPEVLTAMRDLLRDLISTGVGEETLLRVQLRMAGRLLRHLTEPANGYEMLREMVSCGEVPLDPLAALLDVTALELNDFLLRCISPERFVFSVTGPLFAEDIDLFLTR